MKHKHRSYPTIALAWFFGATSATLISPNPSWANFTTPKPISAVSLEKETIAPSVSKQPPPESASTPQQSAPSERLGLESQLDLQPEAIAPYEPQHQEPSSLDAHLQRIQSQGLPPQDLQVEDSPQETVPSHRERQFDTEIVPFSQITLTDFTGIGVGDLATPVRAPFRIENPAVFTAEDLEILDTGFFFSIFPNSNRAKEVYGVATLGVAGSGGNSALLELEGGQRSAGLALSYTQAAIVTEERRSIGYRFSAFTARSPNDIFLGGGTPVYLPMGFQQVPWVNRTGGRVSLFVPQYKSLVLIPSVGYQHVQISRGAFNDEDIPRDRQGNRLSFANDGTDDLLTIALAAQYVEVSRDEEVGIVVEGTKFQVGTEQFVPIGDADITANRLSGGIVQYMPMDLFGFAKGPGVLALGLGAGTFIGDLPPYEAFSLGGNSSVRGYADGALGSGRSFVLATAEYRFPIANFRRGDLIKKLRGALFVDYASALGSQGNVPGQPGEVRDKSGSGAGFGVALGAQVELFDFVEYLWIDFAVSDQGNTSVGVNIGDRF